MNQFVDFCLNLRVRDEGKCGLAKAPHGILKARVKLDAGLRDLLLKLLAFDSLLLLFEFALPLLELVHLDHVLSVFSGLPRREFVRVAHADGLIVRVERESCVISTQEVSRVLEVPRRDETLPLGSQRLLRSL